MQYEHTSGMIASECLYLLIQRLRRKELQLVDGPAPEFAQDVHVEFTLPASSTKLSIDDLSHKLLGPAVDALCAHIESIVPPFRKLLFYRMDFPSEPELFCERPSSYDGGCSARFLWNKASGLARLSVLYSCEPSVSRETGIERHFRELLVPLFPMDHIPHTNC